MEYSRGRGGTFGAREDQDVFLSLVNAIDDGPLLVMDRLQEEEVVIVELE
jgi:hypothetical protein